MKLELGDWVDANTGDIGKVVHISGLTVFVAIAIPEMDDIVEAYREDELKKIQRPDNLQSPEVR